MRRRRNIFPVDSRCHSGRTSWRQDRERQAERLMLFTIQAADAQEERYRGAAQRVASGLA